MTWTDINCGYRPLVDSAPLISAQAVNFAAEQGLQLNLVRQPSGSAPRDMLALGHLDAAHMLSPLPVAMSLGLDGLPARIGVPVRFSMHRRLLDVWLRAQPACTPERFEVVTVSPPRRRVT